MLRYFCEVVPNKLLSLAASASMMATTMADTAGMMYSIYVTSVIRYDSFVALASKNARTLPVAGSSFFIIIGSNIRGDKTYPN